MGCHAIETELSRAVWVIQLGLALDTNGFVTFVADVVGFFAAVNTWRAGPVDKDGHQVFAFRCLSRWFRQPIPGTYRVRYSRVRYLPSPLQRGQVSRRNG